MLGTHINAERSEAYLIYDNAKGTYHRDPLSFDTGEKTGLNTVFHGYSPTDVFNRIVQIVNESSDPQSLSVQKLMRYNIARKATADDVKLCKAYIVALNNRINYLHDLMRAAPENYAFFLPNHIQKAEQDYPHEAIIVDPELNDEELQFAGHGLITPIKSMDDLDVYFDDLHSKVFNFEAKQMSYPLTFDDRTEQLRDQLRLIKISNGRPVISGTEDHAVYLISSFLKAGNTLHKQELKDLFKDVDAEVGVEKTLLDVKRALRL